MPSSFSRMLWARLRILRRISASAGEAWSLTSSSLRMAVVISSSSARLGSREEKYTSRQLSEPGLLARHSETERITRSTSAISSSSFRLSMPPAAAREREECTFLMAPKEGAPYLPVS